MLIRRLSLFCCLAASLFLLHGCTRAQVSADRRVLVLEFNNTVSGEDAQSLAASLDDILTAHLIKYDRVAVVKTPVAATSDNWLEAGMQANADYVVVGTFSRLEDNYILTAWLMSTATGESVKGSSVQRACDREEDIYSVLQYMAYELGHHLKVLAERHDAWQATR